MKIGEDFDKIVWEIGDWILLEPNAFIGDTILFFLAIGLANRLWSRYNEHPFYKLWFWFFVVFGIGVFSGGLGHLFWNYWGVEGKYLSWYAINFSVFLVERAMILLHHKEKWKRRLNRFSFAKLLLTTFGLTAILVFVDVEANVSKGLALPLANSGIGTIFSLGILALYYQRNGLGDFRYFWISVLIAFPLVVFQTMKINFYPWMDRNDVSHVLLLVTLLFYYQGIKNVSNLFRFRMNRN